jgi:endonuclease/exonuclease/phosphatase family metal-dependent hydrolase
LHAEAVGRALQPPLGSEPPDTPFQARSHATSAVLCGDFNFEVGSEGHLALAAAGETPVFCDAWRALHGAGVAQPPTFHVHSARYSPVPVACDFVWVSEDLAPRVQAVAVDGATTLSDHQPVLLRLA